MRGGELAGLVVERVVGLRAGRAEDRDLARGAVRREHVERVPHLLQRGVGDLEVAAVGAVAWRGAAPTRPARRSGRRRRASPTCSTSAATCVVELGVAGAVPGELHRRRSASPGAAGRRARPGDVSGRAPRCEITSAAASAPSRPHGAEVVAVGEAVEEPGRVQVAGAGGVDDLASPGAASTTCTSSPRTITAPCSLAGERGDLAVAA